METYRKPTGTESLSFSYFSHPVWENCTCTGASLFVCQWVCRFCS